MHVTKLTCLASPVLLDIGHILLFVMILLIERLHSLVDLLSKVFPALASAAHHEHDLLQTVEHPGARGLGTLLDEVFQPGTLHMPKA